jgi:hypothetical protein
MTALILVSLYCFFFAFLMRKSAFFQPTGIRYSWILGLFAVKVIAGILYGFIHKNYFSGGDTFLYFAESQQLAATFANNPSYCIHSLLGLETTVPTENAYTYPPSPIFWKDLGTYFIIHINAALIPFSGGLYSVHVVFMSFLGLIASILLYKVLKNQIQLNDNLLIISCFLLPSLLFWTAGIHKDVFLFLGLTILMWALQNSRLSWLLLGLLLMGLTRHYTLLLVLPSILAFWATKKEIKKIIPKLLSTSIILFLCVAGLDYFYFNNFIINILANKQQAFFNETGGSDLRNLEPFYNFFELFLQLPAAFTNVVARPFIGECKHIFQLSASIEMVFFWGFFILMLFFNKKIKFNPMDYFLLCFALSYLFLIGFLVANEGTIVRYRAIPISFLTILVWQATDFQLVSKFFKNLFFKKQPRDNFKLYP